MPPILAYDKLAIVYPRQSTGDQVRDNVYSLERQLQLRDRAIADGFSAERVIVIQDDLGISGRTIAKRPGFTRALELIDHGEVAAIYVEDLSRLSRDERTIDQMLIADVCERAGTLIFMGGSWYDMRDAGQRQSYKYQAVGGAEYWRAHLGKMHGAQKQKAQAGKAANGSYRRGYKPNRSVDRRHPDYDRLVPDEPNASFVRELVARVLDAGSIRGFFRDHSPIAWPDGSRLTFSTLNVILTSPVYRGTYVWGDVVIEGAHEALITPEQAASIDAMRELNRTTHRGRASDLGGVFVGLAHCAECGRKLKTAGGKERVAYECAKRSTPLEREYHMSFRVELLDRPVLAAFWERLPNGLIEGAIARLQEAETEAASVLDLNDRGRKALQRKIDGLIEMTMAPGLTADARQVIVDRLNEATRALKELEQRAAPVPHAAAELNAYRAMLADSGHLMARATWDDEPIQWRRGFVRRFVQRIEVRAGKAGALALVVLWADGTTSEHAVRVRRPLKPEELAIIQEALASPECPPTRKDIWISELLQSRGFDRNAYTVGNAIRRLTR